MVKRVLIGFVLGAASSVASAGECSLPPIASAADAICRAQQFAQLSGPPTYALKYQASESGTYWIVYYGPKPDSGVRGGYVEVKVDKATGEVTWVRGHR